MLGKCLDVNGGNTTNGTVVYLYDGNGTAAQTWSPQPNGALVNPQSGKRQTDAASAPSGTQVTINDCTGQSNQRWTVPENPKAKSNPQTRHLERSVPSAHTVQQPRVRPRSTLTGGYVDGREVDDGPKWAICLRYARGLFRRSASARIRRVADRLSARALMICIFADLCIPTDSGDIAFSKVRQAGLHTAQHWTRSSRDPGEASRRREKNSEIRKLD